MGKIREIRDRFNEVMVDRRSSILRVVLCLALSSGMVLCPRLWTTFRTFPTIPSFDGLPDLPQGMTAALAGTLAFSALLTCAFPKPRLPIIAFLISAAVLVLFDINRLQPWFY